MAVHVVSLKVEDTIDLDNQSWNFQTFVVEDTLRSLDGSDDKQITHLSQLKCAASIDHFGEISVLGRGHTKGSM